MKTWILALSFVKVLLIILDVVSAATTYPSSTQFAEWRPAWLQLTNGNGAISIDWEIYYGSKDADWCKNAFNDHVKDDWFSEEVIDSAAGINLVSFGANTGDCDQSTAAGTCSGDRWNDYPSDAPSTGPNKLDGRVVFQNDGILGINFLNEAGQELGLNSVNSPCEDSFEDRQVLSDDGTYFKLEMMAFWRKSHCTNPGFITTFEVTGFGHSPVQHGTNGVYDCAFNYIIVFEPSKIVLLGTIGATEAYDTVTKSVHSYFGVYWKDYVANVQISLAFDNLNLIENRQAQATVIDITIPTLTKTPASANPSLNWSIVGITTNLSFDGQAPADITFDDLNNPSNLQLPDLSGVPAGDYFFDIYVAEASNPLVNSTCSVKIIISSSQCTGALGLTIIANPPADRPLTSHSSAPIPGNASNYFTLSNSNCSIMRFTCKYIQTDVNCDVASNGQMDFDLSTGLISFQRTSASTRPTGLYTYEICALAADDESLNSCFKWKIKVVIPLTGLSFSQSVQKIVRFTDSGPTTEAIMVLTQTPSDVWPQPNLTYSGDDPITFDSTSAPTVIQIINFSTTSVGIYSYAITVVDDTAITATYTLEITVSKPCSLATLLVDQASTSITYSYEGSGTPAVNSWIFTPETSSCTFQISCNFGTLWLVCDSATDVDFTIGTPQISGAVQTTLNIATTDRTTYTPGSHTGTIQAIMDANSSTIRTVNVNIELRDPLTSMSFAMALEPVTLQKNVGAITTKSVQGLTKTPSSPYPAPNLTYSIVAVSGHAGFQFIDFDSTSPPTQIKIPDPAGVPAGVYTYGIIVTDDQSVAGTTGYMFAITVEDPCSVATLVIDNASTQIIHSYSAASSQTWIFTPQTASCALIITCSFPSLPNLCGETGEVSFAVNGPTSRTLTISTNNKVTYPPGVYTGTITATMDANTSISVVGNVSIELRDPLSAMTFGTSTESITVYTNGSAFTHPIQAVIMSPTSPFPIPNLTYSIEAQQALSNLDSMDFDNASSPTLINIPSSGSQPVGLYKYKIKVTDDQGTAVIGDYYVQITVEIPCSLAGLTVDQASTAIQYSYEGVGTPATHIWTFTPQQVSCTMTITCNFPSLIGLCSSGGDMEINTSVNQATLNIVTMDKLTFVPGAYSGTITATLDDNSSATEVVSLSIVLLDPLTAMSFSVVSQPITRFTDSGITTHPVLVVTKVPTNPYPVPNLTYTIVPQSAASALNTMQFDSVSSPTTITIPDPSTVTAGKYDFRIEVTDDQVTPVQANYMLEVTVSIPCSLATIAVDQASTSIEYSYTGSGSPSSNSWTFTPQTASCTMLVTCNFATKPALCGLALNAVFSVDSLNRATLSISTTDKSYYPPGAYSGEIKAVMDANTATTSVVNVQIKLLDPLTLLVFNPATSYTDQRVAKNNQGDVALPNLIQTPSSPYPVTVLSWNLVGQAPANLNFDGNSVPALQLESVSVPSKLTMPNLTGVTPAIYRFVVSVSDGNPEGVNTQITIIIKVNDICSKQNGLSVTTISTLPANIPYAPHSPAPFSWSSLASIFDTNISTCSITNYECIVVSDSKDCADLTSQGRANFDTSTGQFDFDYSSPAVRPLGTYIYEFRAFAGVDQDIQNSFQWSIVVSCAEFDETTFAWSSSIQKSSRTEVILKDYYPGWSWTPAIIDPLNPSNNPVYNIDIACPVLWVIIQTTGYGKDPYVVLAQVEVKRTTDQNDLAISVGAAEPTHWEYFTYSAHLPNFIGKYKHQDDPFIGVGFYFVDGYTLLQVSSYQQLAAPIDLVSGLAQLSWVPPIFKDDVASNIQLQNPTSSPERTIFFKVFGNESAPVSSYITVDVVDNTLNSPITVKFSQSKVNKVASFDLIACYSYGSYSNLQDLCDTSVRHSVTNGLGSCFTNLSFTITAAGQAKKTFTYELGTNGFVMAELTDYAQLYFSIAQNYGAGKDCGSIAYKLVNEAQAALITISATGKVSIVKTSESQWLGQHTLNFFAYMKDIDSTLIHTHQLTPVTLILDVSEVKASGAANFTEELIRQAPISIEPIAPRYYVDLNITSSFLFSFADPLALAAEGEEGLEFGGLEVRISRNTLAAVFQLGEIDVGRGMGFATAQLVCDGDKAFQELVDLMAQQALEATNPEADKDAKSTQTVPTIEGTVTLAVRDKSSGGLTREFDIYFTIVQQEPTSEDKKSESTTVAGSATDANTTQKPTEAIKNQVVDYEATIKAEALKKQVIINTMIDSSANLKQKLRFKYKSLVVEPPRVRIKQLTSTGLIYLTFSNDMNIPKIEDNRKLSQEDETVPFEAVLQLKQMIDVQFIKDPDVDTDDDAVDEEEMITWKVESYTEKIMAIKVNFADPMSVSQHGADKVRITFSNTTLIYDWLGQELQNGTFIERIMPPQFASQEEAEVFAAVEEAFSSYETGDFSQDVAVNSIIAGFLQYCWSLVSAQQIIIMIPLFAINMPANGKTIFGVLLQVAAFEMIPTDKVYEDMMLELEKLNEGEEIDMLQEKMEKLGFETTWLLPNLGSLLFFLGLYPLIMLLLLIVHIITVSCAKSCKSKRNFLIGQAFWNWPITYLRDSYVVIATCCLYNYRYRSWDCEEASLNTNLTIGSLTVLLFYPILIQLYLYKRRDLLGKESFLRRYSRAYEGLDTKDGKFFLYPLFFYYRRLLVPMSVIFWPDMIFVQYFTLVMTGVATIILLGYKRPYASQSRNQAEIIQECTIIITMYHILCFTDWLPDLETRHYIGYSVITVVLGQLFITLAVFATQSLCSSLTSMKRNKLLRIAKKKAKQDLKKHKPQIKKALATRKGRRRQNRHRNEYFKVCLDSEEDEINANEIVEEVDQAAEKSETDYKNQFKLETNPLHVIRETDEESASAAPSSRVQNRRPHIVSSSSDFSEIDEIKSQESKQLQSLSDDIFPPMKLDAGYDGIDIIEEEKQVTASLQELNDLFPKYTQARMERINAGQKTRKQSFDDNQEDNQEEAAASSKFMTSYFYDTQQSKKNNQVVHPHPLMPQQNEIIESDVRNRMRENRREKIEKQLGYSGLFNY